MGDGFGEGLDGFDGESGVFSWPGCAEGEQEGAFNAEAFFDEGLGLRFWEGGDIGSERVVGDGRFSSGGGNVFFDFFAGGFGDGDDPLGALGGGGNLLLENEAVFWFKPFWFDEEGDIVDGCDRVLGEGADVVLRVEDGGSGPLSVLWKGEEAPDAVVDCRGDNDLEPLVGNL